MCLTSTSLAFFTLATYSEGLVWACWACWAELCATWFWVPRTAGGTSCRTCPKSEEETSHAYTSALVQLADQRTRVYACRAFVTSCEPPQYRVKCTRVSRAFIAPRAAFLIPAYPVFQKHFLPHGIAPPPPLVNGDFNCRLKCFGSAPGCSHASYILPATFVSQTLAMPLGPYFQEKIGCQVGGSETTPLLRFTEVERFLGSGHRRRC